MSTSHLSPSPSPAARTAPSPSPPSPPRPASGHWTFSEHDAAWAADIQKRLPDALFDVHAHLYDADHLHCPWTGFIGEGPRCADLSAYQSHQAQQIGPDRLKGSLLFAYPTPDCDVTAANAWMLRQIEQHPASRVLLLVTPATDPATLVELGHHPQVAGVKVYHCYSTTRPTFDARIPDFVPEWLWTLCNERQWALMLHLVRDHALNDPHNRATLRDRCRRYPHMKLVLAHAGRGFNKWDTIAGVPSLQGLDNVWFDSSCICEPDAFSAILHTFGPKRLMWGSDFPISERRGKCVSVGERFCWINPSTIDDNNPDASPCPTVLVGLESLRALLRATEEAGLNASDLKDIFHDNAARLLGLIRPREATASLYRQARRIIPGGTQLLSKRPEMFAPDQWPAYFSRARGCETWDLDGRHYYDLSISGIGACLLGFADPDVSAAVTRAVSAGTMCSLNPPEEVALAERLCDLHPWAQRARFTRTGGEAMAVAVRIARAATGRSDVAICGYHGWHDWYLAANLEDTQRLRGHLLPGLAPTGVPAELAGTVHPFAYNAPDALDAIIADRGSRLAAIVLEPMRHTPPAPGFLEHVRQQAKCCGAVLIFDEVTSGWRSCLGGVHLRLGHQPDIAVFAKALGNGYPIAAIIGTDAAMDAAEGAFISSSYWTESIGPVAALATLEKMQRVDVAAHLREVGRTVAASWRRHAAAAALPVTVTDTCPALCQFTWDHPQSQVLRTLYTQAMLEQGFLAGQTLYATLAHDEHVMDLYDTAIARAFSAIADALASGAPEQHLRGPVAHSGFQRLVS